MERGVEANGRGSWEDPLTRSPVADPGTQCASAESVVFSESHTYYIPSNEITKSGVSCNKFALIIGFVVALIGAWQLGRLVFGNSKVAASKYYNLLPNL